MTTDTERTLRERLRNPPYISHPGICRPTFDDATAREDMREAADRLDTLEARVKVLEADNKQVSDQLEYYSAFADQSATAIINAKAETIERCAQAAEKARARCREIAASATSSLVEHEFKGRALEAKYIAADIRALKETPDV